MSPSAQRPALTHLSSSLSQQSLPSTADPASPVDPTASFQTELNDDRLSPPRVIRSSLTPPPSAQVIQRNVAVGIPPARADSQQTSSIISPPATTLRGPSRGRPNTTDYLTPGAEQIDNANIDELRTMLQSCLSINAKLKSETAHHKLQYELLSMQAAEDTNRANVEHEMTRREVEALRTAEHARQARRELETRVDPIQAKYRELQQTYDALTKEHNDLLRRFKSASKLIQQQAEEIYVLNDDREMLLNRIRENRQHFKMLCSPGGAFHGVLTPKTPSTSPQQHRATPRQTPRGSNKGGRHENETDAAGFAALLQALKQDNSAPSTPTSAGRAPPRAPFRQHRAAHSLSSLPATPYARSRGNAGLLPSIDLVPRTEPAQRFGNRVGPQTPTPKRRRKSRESTISAEDENEGNARTMTLESVAAAAQSYMSHSSHPSQRRDDEEEEVFESQATQAASEMLRRDPRESFEVASSVGSRDVTPVPAEKTAKLQTKLYGPVYKAGMSTEKRKFSGGSNPEDMRMEAVISPTKKVRYGADGPGIKAVLSKAPTDTVILSSLRTPICRSYKGQLKDAYPEELLSVVLRATLDANPNLNPAEIQDVAVGVVLSELGGSKAGRMAMNHVGFPNSTSLYTVNRACSSSLQSIAAVAAQIQTGMIDTGIAAGTESMTRNYASRAIPVDLWPALRDSPNRHARDCIMPMGLTSENVAARHAVSRADQDALAVESHLRAARARDSGAFDAEIVPVHTRFQEVDKAGNKVGEEQQITVTRDDGIRANVTLEALAKLKPAFKADGTSTAGNSSQVSDGAAATLLIRRSTATALGLSSSIIGKFVGAATVGCDPDEMGVGPAIAIPALLNRFGITNADVHRWEINEAFASQAIYCLRALGLEEAWVRGEVNPDGGAIALGHPLGATGARMTSTLLHGLARSSGEVGVVSMCVGTGMGMAGLFVRE
ncbi:Thiolase, N-terminal domain-containing protein [Xylaria venustula]|nr:Thiolase, N-terminal domain-containing protein [Xylaria venustula]